MGQKTLNDTMQYINNFLLMKLNKPKFWDKKISIISILLFHFTLIYFINFFKKKFTKNKFNIPIICVGNIYLVEQVKPHFNFLAKELLN